MKPVFKLSTLVFLLTVSAVAHAQVFSDDAQLGLEPTSTKCTDLSSKAGSVELNVRCNFAEGGAIPDFLSKRDKACVDRELDALKGALADPKHRDLLEKLKLSRIVLELSDNSHAKIDDAKLEYGAFLGTALVREGQTKAGSRGQDAEYAFASYEKNLRGDEATKIGFDWKPFADTATHVVGKHDVTFNDKLVRKDEGFTSCFEKCDRPRTQELVSCNSTRDDRCTERMNYDYDHNYWLNKRNAPSIADWTRLYPTCGECYAGKTDVATTVTGRGRQRLETVMAVKFAIPTDGKCGSTIVAAKDFTDSFESWRKESERLDALEKVDLGAKAASAIGVFGTPPPSVAATQAEDAPPKLITGPTIAATKPAVAAPGATVIR